jgi:hypothetical protein
MKVRMRTRQTEKISMAGSFTSRSIGVQRSLAKMKTGAVRRKERRTNSKYFRLIFHWQQKS